MALPSTRAAPAEIERESARVLPHLAARARVLAPAADDSFGVYALLRRSRRTILTTREEFVRGFLRAELIERSSDPRVNAATGGSAFVLSALGARFVKRLGATDNPFAAQHRVLVPHRSLSHSARPPAYNAAESPLGWLRTRKDRDGKPYISEAEFKAGERLRADFTLALMTPKATLAWPLERVDCSSRLGASPMHQSERAASARTRFWLAIDAVGHELANVLIAVVCHLEGLEAIEARLAMPARSSKIVLKVALGALARHYGLMRDDARAAVRAMTAGELPAE